MLVRPHNEVTFGIGIDHGTMLATKTGIRRHGSAQQSYRSLVWLGRPANVASKLTDNASKPEEATDLIKLRVAYRYFGNLSKSLQAGNLADAQQAYSQLQKALGGNQAASNNGTSSNASAAKLDFSNVGKALAAGDLKGAQAAFTQLSSDLSAAKAATGTPGVGKHHHHGSDPDGDNDGSTSASTAATASAGSTISLLG